MYKHKSLYIYGEEDCIVQSIPKLIQGSHSSNKSDKNMNTNYCTFSETFEKCQEIYSVSAVSEELLKEAENELSRMHHEQHRNPCLMNWRAMIEEQVWEIQTIKYFLEKEKNIYICC